MLPAFDDAEARLLDSAQNDLPALALAGKATAALASAIEGAAVPPRDDPAPPSYYLVAATLFLGVLGLRTSRAMMLVVSAGYAPEAHALKRRLSEAHARAQAVAGDHTGQHARQWLEGKPPSVGKLANRFMPPELWELYSWGSHADSRSVHWWLSVPLGGQDDGPSRGLTVAPAHHDERLSNALLVECAMECRDLASAVATVRGGRIGDIERLDAEIGDMAERYYAPLHESANHADG